MNFYCRSYCLLNMFRAPLCPSSGAREYYTSGCCLSYLVLGFQVVSMLWSWGLCVRYNTLELLIMGIMVPETCWASNKICNKNSSVASSWHFISTYYWRCTVKTTSKKGHLKVKYTLLLQGWWINIWHQTMHMLHRGVLYSIPKMTQHMH